MVTPICFAVLSQLKLRGLLHWQIARLGSLENFIYVDSDAPIAVREVRPVVHEPTSLYRFSAAVHRRYSALYHKVPDSFAVTTG